MSTDITTIKEASQQMQFENDLLLNMEHMDIIIVLSPQNQKKIVQQSQTISRKRLVTRSYYVFDLNM